MDLRFAQPSVRTISCKCSWTTVPCSIYFLYTCALRDEPAGWIATRQHLTVVNITTQLCFSYLMCSARTLHRYYGSCLADLLSCAAISTYWAQCRSHHFVELQWGQQSGLSCIAKIAQISTKKVQADSCSYLYHIFLCVFRDVAFDYH